MLMLKKVRMLTDYPPGAEGEAALYRAGAIREVDAARCARLVADGNAEELPANWTAAKEAAATAALQDSRAAVKRVPGKRKSAKQARG
jgi:hypothetical protein